MPSVKVDAAVKRPGEAAKHGVRFWNADWQAFLDAHGDWWNTFGSKAEVAYCLPVVMIDSLAQRKFIDEPMRQAEVAFEAVCSRHFAVGVSVNRPINYQLLCGIPSPSNKLLQSMKNFGWNEKEIAAASPAVMKSLELQERLKGWAGILITEPRYLEHRDKVRTSWHALPESERPALPLGLGVQIAKEKPGRARQGRKSTRLEKFYRSFEQLCDRWGLLGLATWDLPSPQGPLMPAMTREQVLQTRGPMVFLAIPLGIQIMHSDAVQQMIAEEQENDLRARDLGFDPRAISRWRVYGQIFEIAHYQRIVLERYGKCRGIISAIRTGLASHLGHRGARIDELRRYLAACERGERPSLRKLR